MPHKRAKRAARGKDKSDRVATDLVPKISIEHEPIPASVSRVLDAEQIRREYRKRQLDGVGSSDGDHIRHKKRRHGGTNVNDDSTAFRIQPSETISQFNKRVENSMQPLIRTALRQSSAVVRRVRREEAAQETLKQGKPRKNTHRPVPGDEKKGSDPPPTDAASEQVVNPRDAGKEFQVVPTSAPRRLNDIAQEPPIMKSLPRGATKDDAVPSGVLSMAQKAMMEEERNKAIRHYRELKARRLHDAAVMLNG